MESLRFCKALSLKPHLITRLGRSILMMTRGRKRDRLLKRSWWWRFCGEYFGVTRIKLVVNFNNGQAIENARGATSGDFA